MAENIVAIVVAVLASNWFGSVIKDTIDSRRKKKKPTEQMILALGRRQLLSDAKHYLEMQEIPEDEYEAFEEQFKAYIAMNGNSKVKRLCSEALELPIR